MTKIYVFVPFFFLITLGGEYSIALTGCTKKYKALENGGQKHSLCMEPASNYKSGAVPSKTNQALIVDKHNEYRGQVDPPASNMQKMSWDDELASIALGWATQCKQGHETSYYWRQVPDMYPVGQNVARGSISISWQQVLEAWYNERIGFVFGDERMNLAAHAHYTQVVWHDSTRIGCAAAICDETRGGVKYFVCDYAPAGNIYPGWTSPYLKSNDGKSCSKCSTYCQNNLCDLGSFLCYNGGKLDIEKKTCSCTEYSAAFNNGPQCSLDCGKILPDARRKYFQCPRSMEKCMAMRTSVLYCPDSCNVCPKDSAKSGTNDSDKASGGAAKGPSSSSGGGVNPSSGGIEGETKWWDKSSSGVTSITYLNGTTSCHTLWEYFVAIFLIKFMLWLKL